MFKQAAGNDKRLLEILLILDPPRENIFNAEVIEV